MMFSRRWRLPPPTSKISPPKQALPDRYESSCDWSWIREFRATTQVCNPVLAIWFRFARIGNGCTVPKERPRGRKEGQGRKGKRPGLENLARASRGRKKRADRLMHT